MKFVALLWWCTTLAPSTNDNPNYVQITTEETAGTISCPNYWRCNLHLILIFNLLERDYRVELTSNLLVTLCEHSGRLCFAQLCSLQQPQRSSTPPLRTFGVAAYTLAYTSGCRCPSTNKQHFKIAEYQRFIIILNWFMHFFPTDVAIFYVGCH